MRDGAYFFLLVIAFLAASTRSTTQDENHGTADRSCQHDRGLRTYQQWRQTVTIPYAAPSEKLLRVRDNYDKLEIGSSKEEVIKAFGSPDYEQEMYPKKANRPCLGYAFKYYFEKPDETANELKDKTIEVFFTPEGRVNWIAGNVGLQEKGAPSPRP